MIDIFTDRLRSGTAVEVQDCRLRNIGTATALGNVRGILVSANRSYIAGNEVYEMTSNGVAARGRGIQVPSQALGIYFSVARARQAMGDPRWCLRGGVAKK